MAITASRGATEKWIEHVTDGAARVVNRSLVRIPKLRRMCNRADGVLRSPSRLVPHSQRICRARTRGCFAVPWLSHTFCDDARSTRERRRPIARFDSRRQGNQEDRDSKCDTENRPQRECAALRVRPMCRAVVFFRAEPKSRRREPGYVMPSSLGVSGVVSAALATCR